MSLFSNLWYKNKLDKSLKRFWRDKKFINGKRFFWFANYGFFHIVDSDEFIDFNSDIEDDMFLNKKVIAISDWNGDHEHTAHLYVDTKTFDILLFDFYSENRNFVKVPSAFQELFYTSNLKDILITKDDENFIHWYEGHDYKTLPNGIFPPYDLRHHFKEIANTYFSPDSTFNKEAFKTFLIKQNLSNYCNDDFQARGYHEALDILITKINSENPQTLLKKVIFKPSFDWGITNVNNLNIQELSYLKSHGIIQD